jgi:hypothetical protein
VKVNVGAFNMPDNLVSNEVLLKIVERLDTIEQQMHKGFAALTHGQDDLRRDQEAMRSAQFPSKRSLNDCNKNLPNSKMKNPFTTGKCSSV